MKLITALLINYAVSTVLSLQTGSSIVKPEVLKNVLSRILANLLQTNSNLRVRGTLRDWMKKSSRDIKRLTNDATVDNTLYIIQKISADLNRFTGKRHPQLVFGKKKKDEVVVTTTRNEGGKRVKKL